MSLSEDAARILEDHVMNPKYTCVECGVVGQSYAQFTYFVTTEKTLYRALRPFELPAGWCEVQGKTYCQRHDVDVVIEVSPKGYGRRAREIDAMYGDAANP